MESLIHWVMAIKHNYVLLIIGAVLFFGIKSLIGFFTYRKFAKDLEEIKSLLRNPNRQ
jgi:uncharacterized protein YneF (UPF0154 family)